MDVICIDASPAAKIILRNERLRGHARQLFADACASGGELIAPPIFVSEIDSIIRRREFNGGFTSSEANIAFRKVDEMAVTILALPGMRTRAREIAREFNQERVYDSTYAALAEI